MKNILKYLIIVTLYCSATVVAAPKIWDGSADVSWYEESAQTYNLTTAEQLAGLAKLVNEGTSDFFGKTITLGADIFLNDTTGAGAGTWGDISHRNWIPIGSSDYPFRGEFDGLAGKNNRKIYGLYVTRGGGYAGFFGYTRDVKISNLDLLVVRISSGKNTGTLIGYAEGGSVVNVHSEASVRGSMYVGGLVGYFSGILSTSSMKGYVTGNEFVGGLVGYTMDSIFGIANANCFFVGSVNGLNYVGGIVGSGVNVSKSYVKGSVSGYDYIGGVVGYSTGIIDSVYHVDGDVEGDNYVGGIVGYSSDSIKSSYSDGNVMGKNQYIGGVAGYAVKSIDLVYHVGGSVNGYSCVGGVAGYVRMLSDSYSEGNVIGVGNYVGGVVGLAGYKDAVFLYGSKILKSYAKGSVKSDSNYVGGVVGYAVGGEIDSAYHIGGNVSGFSYVGGVAGRASLINSTYHIDGFISGKSNYVGGVAGYGFKILKSYAKGPVKSDSNYVGGVVGYAVEGVVDSAYHIGGNVSGFNYVGGVTGIADTIGSSYHSGGNVNGLSCIGGVAGQVGYSVINSYSEGNVTGIGDYIGGLVGRSLYSYKGSASITITALQNSYAVGNVKGNDFVGGLVGMDSIYGDDSDHNYAYEVNRLIHASHAQGTVEGKKYVGGVIGKSNYGTYYSNSNKIFYEMIVSSHHVGGDVIGQSDYVGGVAGFAYGLIDSSYHTGGNVNGLWYVGGLIGISIDSIKNSYSEGNVIGKWYVGGVAGLAQGSIDSSFHSNGDVNGLRYVGGLVGQVNSSVKNSYSEGNVSGNGNYVGGLIGLALRRINTTDLSKADTTYIKESYSIGDVWGLKYVGGLIGADSIYKELTKNRRNDYYSRLIVRIISKNSSKGNVKGLSFVGGLIGAQNVGSDSSNRYSNSRYTAFSTRICNANGSISADSSYVGGLVGYARGYIDSTVHIGGGVSGSSFVGGVAGQADSLVKNSYSEGNVTGSGYYVGGLVGYGKGLSRSYAKGSVKNSSSYAGGVIGYASGTIDSAYHVDGDVNGLSYIGGVAGQVGNTVINSYSEGSVTGMGNYVGGLVGCGKYISKSYVKGAVISDSNYVGGVAGSASSIDSTYHIDGDVSGYGFVGGLAGSAYSIFNSYSEGSVYGVKDYVGGLVGFASNKISGSYAEAKIVRGQNLVGGLTGYAGDSIDVSYFEGDSVTGIYQIGGLAGRINSIIDSSYSTANIKGDDNVGGLIGSAYGNVSNSYAIGDVVGDVEHSSVGNDNLGGLVGYQYVGSISKSFALGNVSGTTKLGGLVGRFDGDKISQSYANVDVSGNYYGSPADGVGNYYIGGLVGYAKGALEETYASGVVSGIKNEPVYTGCIVGYVNGSLSVSKSYYDKAKCGLGVDGGENTASVSGIPGKTTVEMQTQSTFEDWDFTNTWRIEDNTYPFLQMFANSLKNSVVTTESLEGLVYDGVPKTPQVSKVTLFDGVLTEGIDYTVKYEKNVNAGIAKISVCGINLYSGCKKIEYEIAPVSINPTIAAIDNVIYTGLPLTPEIKVYNGKMLLAATDYDVEYKDNVNSGTASVTITMNGNYRGSASKTFTIKKATPVISQNPKASDVFLGQMLAASKLSNGYANVNGDFVWKNPTTKPVLENEGYAVMFIPTDTKNYTNSVEIVVPVKVFEVYVVVYVGNVILDSVALEKNSSYTLPKAPDSTGYDFIGFYKESSVVGKSGDKISVTENMVIDAAFKKKLFIITFMNGSTKLKSSEVAYGVVPIAPKVTLPENTVQYTYKFGGWDKEIVAVTESKVYTAVINRIVNKYNVVFKDYDENVLMDSTYEYGTAVAKIAKPANPTRATTAQYTYTFKEWTPVITSVVGDATYKAIFDSVVNRYLITFKNEEGILQSSYIGYGMSPKYTGQIPAKQATAQYTYVFKEWTPTITNVVGDATYKAVFDSVVNKYLITFENENGILQSTYIEYGKNPQYTGQIPAKQATVQYTYAFKEWTPTITNVIGDATYKAVFDSVVKTYVISFENGNEILQSSYIGYGMNPQYTGQTPAKQATAQYTYAFKEWTPTITNVIGDATYKAVFDSVVNKYLITFENENGILQSDYIEYGMNPKYTGRTPVKQATAQYTYVFKEWTPAITNVVCDATYKAAFDSVLKTYVITFENENEILQSGYVAYGMNPKYTGKTPVKKATTQYSYVFKDWNPAIVKVTETANYMAVFDSVVNWYLITFKYGSIVLQKDSLAYGVTPDDPSVTLPKNTAKYTYSFKGWDKSVVAVTGNATYSAVIDSMVNRYKIVFMNGNTQLQISDVTYGEAPKYTGNTPTKKSSKTYSYKFKEWSPKIVAVTKAATYTAVFDSTKLTGIIENRYADLGVSVKTAARVIQISAAPIGSVYAITDLRGRVLKKGRVESANFNIAMPQAGVYMVRIGSQSRKVNLR